MTADQWFAFVMGCCGGAVCSIVFGLAGSRKEDRKMREALLRLTDAINNNSRKLAVTTRMN
ncbi:hypothetical protein [Zavarzinella formosa]|uniref:hypothetical protein n=1 Tax=Zavarzinella formosa TaxID=360055 RepID=UPI000319AFB1|nr:hypothetical protein [Zavarzinella formosa]